MHAIAKQKSPVNSIFEILVGRHTTNFWLQKVNPLWSMHQPLGKIIEKNQSAQETISLTIEVNRHFDINSPIGAEFTNGFSDIFFN